MATAAQYPNRFNEITEARQPGGKMIERKDPRFVKFADGEMIEGVLLNIERIEVNNKPATRYTVLEEGGEMVSFLGTYQIDSKIRTGDMLHRVSIRYEGEDKSVSRSGNSMKLFKVLVSENRVLLPPATSNSAEISDEDIPF